MTARSPTSSRSRAPPRPTPSGPVASGPPTRAWAARRPRATARSARRSRSSPYGRASAPAQGVTWREGSRGRMHSRFLALRVRPANRELRAAATAVDAELPVRWLLAEWPSDADAPTDYWLSSLPPDTALRTLVRLAKLRWRIEHDYRELKDGARPRSLRGPQLPRLAPPRHLRLGRSRLPDPGTPAPENQGGSLTLYALLRELQRLIACWHGHCPTCRRPLPPTSPLRGPP